MTTDSLISLRALRALEADISIARNSASIAYVQDATDMPAALAGDLCLLIAGATALGGVAAVTLAELHALQAMGYMSGTDLTDDGADAAAAALILRGRTAGARR